MMMPSASLNEPFPIIPISSISIVPKKKRSVVVRRWFHLSLSSLSPSCTFRILSSLYFPSSSSSFILVAVVALTLMLLMLLLLKIVVVVFAGFLLLLSVRFSLDKNNPFLLPNKHTISGGKLLDVDLHNSSNFPLSLIYRAKAKTITDS